MLGRYEKMFYHADAGIWAGKYKNFACLPHWHVDHEVIHCETGKIFVTLNEQSITLGPGDSVCFFSWDIHQLSTEPETINSMIIFNPLKLPRNLMNARLQDPVIRNDTAFHSAFDVVYREVNELPPRYQEMSYSSLSQYLVLLTRTYPSAEPTDADEHKVSVQNRLAEALTNSSAYITFQDAAKAMGYSEAYFSRYFKSMFGVTFSQYMNAIKISDAMLLLRGDSEMTITEVATCCGFNTIRHFNRVFKELTGVSPSEFVSSNADSPIPSIQLGKHFFPTLSSSIRINYFEDPAANRWPY